MASGRKRFFEQLEGLESAAQADAAFDRYILRPISLAHAEFFARLYTHLIEAMLRWLGLPAGAGAELREWRPLFELPRAVDPHYFTAEQIGRSLAECPPMGATQRESLSDVLRGYFTLRREGFPAEFPSPMLGQREAERWTSLFPGELRWKSLAVLQSAGLYPVGSLAGYRAFKRFEEGRFETEAVGDGLSIWWALCGDFPPEPPRTKVGRAGAVSVGGAAQRRDFHAAAFAGGEGALGLEGFCGDVPRCGRCSLSGDCAWANGPAGSGATSAGLLSRLGQNRGAELSDAQLLQGLLRLDGEQAQVVVEGLKDTSLRRLAGKSPRELEAWLEGSGVGREKLLGLFELCRRYSEEPLVPGVALVTARKVFDHFRVRLRDLKQEQFLVVLLDTRRRFLGEVMVSQGTLNSSPVHPREVFNSAIRERAASVIVVHNHPSGDPTPSGEDIKITRRLVTAGQTVGIPLVDHVIVGGEEYFSFVERELM